MKQQTRLFSNTHTVIAAPRVLDKYTILLILSFFACHSVSELCSRVSRSVLEETILVPTVDTIASASSSFYNHMCLAGVFVVPPSVADGQVILSPRLLLVSQKSSACELRDNLCVL